MNNRRRLLHLSSLALSRGGIETFLVNMTKGFANRHDLVIASSGDQSFIGQIQVLNGRTAKWGAKNILDPDAYQQLWMLIEQERPDLVHIHDARAGWIGRFTLASKHIPVIITAHLPSYYYRRKRFTKLWRGGNAVMEAILNRSLTTKLVYPSLSGYRYALKWGIAPYKKAVSIPNGIDTGLFFVDPMEIIAFRGQMQVKPNQVVICTLGRLSIEKNFSLVIRAFSIIQAGYPDASLWIVGDGPERGNLEEQVKAGGLVERVRFISGDSNIALTLASCDIFVLGSWYEGGRTLSVMEAQASGKPCVVSKVGDLPWMIEDGIQGYVFPEGDVEGCAGALKMLLENTSLREAMGQKAREKALQEYGLDKMIEQYESVYETILKNKTA
jgi:glycosyltransferase involved in cell wall biosynthesis